MYMVYLLTYTKQETMINYLYNNKLNYTKKAFNKKIKFKIIYVALYV